MSISSSQFDSLFKPISQEEVLQRRLSNCIKNSDGTYSSDGNVDLSNLGLTKLLVKFKYVKGNFNCSYNKLTSLKGSPIKVGGYFDCNNNQLTSLEGSPQEVGGDFNCSYNKLTSLEGAPQEVGGSFYCSHNSVPCEKLMKTVKRSYL